MKHRMSSDSHALVRDGRVILKGSKKAMLRELRAMDPEKRLRTQPYYTTRKVGEVLGTGAGI